MERGVFVYDILVVLCSLSPGSSLKKAPTFNETAGLFLLPTRGWLSMRGNYKLVDLSMKNDFELPEVEISDAQPRVHISSETCISCQG